MISRTVRVREGGYHLSPAAASVIDRLQPYGPTSRGGCESVEQRPTSVAAVIACDDAREVDQLNRTGGAHDDASSLRFHPGPRAPAR